MSGQRPIDRVREAEDPPRIYDQERQRFADKQAQLRENSRVPAEPIDAVDEATSTEADDA